MRAWLVAGAVIESPTGLLLVANRRRDGRIDWSTPGGVVDDGEAVIEGLGREVTEETGLVVEGWVDGPLYRIEAVAPDLGWDLRVEVHRAGLVTGSLACGDDPDGIVVDAEWLAAADCRERLGTAPPWVRLPLTAWLEERWEDPRTFRYHVEGSQLGSIRVHEVG